MTRLHEVSAAPQLQLHGGGGAVGDGLGDGAAQLRHPAHAAALRTRRCAEVEPCICVRVCVHVRASGARERWRVSMRATCSRDHLLLASLRLQGCSLSAATKLLSKAQLQVTLRYAFPLRVPHPTMSSV